MMTNPKKSQNPKKRGQKKEKENKVEETTSTTNNLKNGLISILLSVVVAACAIIVNNKGSIGMDYNTERTDYGDYDDIGVLREPPPWEPAQPQVTFFLSRACTVIYCHKSIKASNRIFRAKNRIDIGEKLFEIPRSMQIWDLDALRDPFVRKHLFLASHKLTGNHLGSEAFLAAYLALQIYEMKSGSSSIDPLRMSYFNMLPTLEDFDYHPVIGNQETLKKYLGKSSAYTVLESYQNMIVSEYEGFANVSPEFARRISKEDYFMARLNVLTRAIRVGPPGPEEAMKGSFKSTELQDQDLLTDELQAYKDLVGLDLMDESVGCIALIPIADMFNHHPQNNVEFKYKGQANDENRTSGSFVITVDHRAVEEGYEPMVSYGTMADSHLFARYGFVNGDGSGHTQVSIAHHHDILRLNISSQYDYLPHAGTTQRFIEFQKRPMANYLKYDDGYDDCIPGPTTHPEEAHLKRLKYKHLIMIANDIEKWVTLMPPRQPNSLPAPVSTVPITTVTPQFIREFVMENYSTDKIQETCRLLSMVNSDFDGNAVKILEEHVGDESFVVGMGDDHLEFRSLFCIGRWVGTNLVTMEYEGTMRSEFERVEKLNKKAFGTQKWAAYHVRFGEMQALQALGNLVVARVQQDLGDVLPNEFKMRDDPCPDSYSDFLFEDEVDKLMAL